MLSLQLAHAMFTISICWSSQCYTQKLLHVFTTRWPQQSACTAWKSVCTGIFTDWRGVTIRQELSPVLHFLSSSGEGFTIRSGLLLHSRFVVCGAVIQLWLHTWYTWILWCFCIWNYFCCFVFISLTAIDQTWHTTVPIEKCIFMSKSDAGPCSLSD